MSHNMFPIKLICPEEIRVKSNKDKILSLVIILELSFSSYELPQTHTIRHFLIAFFVLPRKRLHIHKPEPKFEKYQRKFFEKGNAMTFQDFYGKCATPIGDHKLIELR